MKPPRLRSTGMEETIAAPATAAPSDSEQAFEHLYRESRDDVYAYAAGLLRDRSAAEEVTSAAFERAWRKRRQIDPRRGSPRAWLFGIARNAALDELRRRRRHAVLDPERPRDTRREDPLEAAVDRAVLRTALTRLGARDRELVALKFFAGLANAEIAAVVGVSESNAGTRIHRVVEKLRRELS